MAQLKIAPPTRKYYVSDCKDAEPENWDEVRASTPVEAAQTIHADVASCTSIGIQPQVWWVMDPENGDLFKVRLKLQWVGSCEKPSESEKLPRLKRGDAVCALYPNLEGKIYSGVVVESWGDSVLVCWSNATTSYVDRSLLSTSWPTQADVVFTDKEIAQ